VGVREPAADRDGVLWVEDVGGGGVVDDDCFAEVAADLGEILDVIALMVITTFSEKPVVHYAVYIKLI